MTVELNLQLELEFTLISTHTDHSRRLTHRAHCTQSIDSHAVGSYTDQNPTPFIPSELTQLHLPVGGCIHPLSSPEGHLTDEGAHYP